MLSCSLRKNVSQWCAGVKTVLHLLRAHHCTEFNLPLHRAETSGLPPEEAPVMIAEKRKLFFLIEQKQQQLLRWQPVLNRARKQDLHGSGGQTNFIAVQHGDHFFPRWLISSFSAALRSSIVLALDASTCTQACLCLGHLLQLCWNCTHPTLGQATGMNKDNA